MRTSLCSATSAGLVLALTLKLEAAGAGFAVRQVIETQERGRATLRVRSSERSPHAIPKHITGKFAEHLGANIYRGMEAQILRNPTFADYPFWSGQMSPDGVTRFFHEDERINQRLRQQAGEAGWPGGELEALVTARADGLACFWTRVGSREEVEVSPDTGPKGGRAQRFQVRAKGQGIAQWTYLPLHRVRRYEVEVLTRSPEVRSLSVSLASAEAPAATTLVELSGLAGEWRVLRAQLELPASAPAEGAYRCALLAGGPGQVLMARAALRPADHVSGADPDVVRLLKESRLPILRWPGGNFVSGYHWTDGVGPLEQRPTLPNYAWGAVEPNWFGTDEFVAFCRAVGCEPMICVNAGNGTAEEAAHWIEYCNGPVSSPMGARRAANGHPEPFGVRHWEIGNELWGRWQYFWTTAAGYVDRYRQFAPAMLAADPTIRLYACGAPVLWGKRWNDTLINGTASSLQSTTDHPLVGGDVPPETDPLDVYRDFMAVPEVLEHKWAALREDMRRAGIAEPRLAVTELQLFAHVGRPRDPQAPARLSHANLVSQGSITEGIYDVLLYHTAVRLAPFVEMVTHSATVNHGGGLRKERERVYANPCHYAQAAFAAFAGATPVALEIATPIERAPLVLPDLKPAVSAQTYGVIDALAAMATDGSLLISLVHRGTGEPMEVTIELGDLKTSGSAELRLLQAALPWVGNTLRAPETVMPHDSRLPVSEGSIKLVLPPYSVARLRVPKA